mgnify:FL=1
MAVIATSTARKKSRIDIFAGKLPLCEENCVVSEWAEWGACSQSCGSDGVQERLRAVTAKESTGEPCAPRVERRICLLEPCPI